jgi:IS30 family transposase
MSYEQLSLEEREVLARLNMAGVSQSRMALELDRDKSTISRELRRNRQAGEYLAPRAQDQAERRRCAAKAPWKLQYEPLASHVREKLSLAWSPEQIAGRLWLDFPTDQRMQISHETIYGWVWADKQQGGNLWLSLRQSRRKHRKRRSGRELRGHLPGRVGIEERPAVVETRERFGDWESDTVGGAGQRGYLATHVERKSRYLVAAKLPNKTAPTFTRRTIRAFRVEPGLPLETMTADNGKEFADFKKMETALGITVYFARPYHSWERGLNENTNGLLRQFFPKSLDLRKVSDQDLDKVLRLINNRPRKRLGYRTPVEVLPRRPAVALQI